MKHSRPSTKKDLPEVDEGCFHPLLKELYVLLNVFVVELSLLDELELLHHFALHHADAVLLDDVLLFGLLDEVAEHGEDDAAHLLLLGVGEDVSQDWDDAKLVHLLGDPGVECQYPKAEG